MLRKELDIHVELVLLEAHHSEELFALVDRNRTYLREWLPWVDATQSPGDTREFIKHTQEQLADDGSLTTAIAVNNELAGVIGFHEICWHSGRGTLGYWLAEEHQGRGIVTMACRAFVEHAFSSLGLEKVEIYCSTLNQKSRAVPERLGFTEEGVIRARECVNGTYHDHVCYGLLKSEFR